MTCDNIRDFFAEALYGELDTRRRAEFDHHIGSCESCRKEFEGLKQTLAMMDERTRVEPTEKEWVEFSKRLGERLTEETIQAGPADTRMNDVVTVPAGTLIPFLPAFRPSWAYGVAAVLLVAFGIYMGRTFFGGNGSLDGPATDPETLTSVSPSAATTDTGGQQIRTGDSEGIGQPVRPDDRPKPKAPPRSGGRVKTTDDTNDDALAYLERSRNLLIGLTNLDAKQSARINLTHQVEVSRQLYDQGNVLTVALNRPSQQQLRQLVQNLQIILLQLTNMEVCPGTPAIELVRQGVDSKSILLKINLEAIRATLNEAQAGVPGRTGNPVRKDL